MKLLLLCLTLILFYTDQASAKCCRMLVGGTVIDRHLGGPGSPLVKKHQQICAEINERWKTSGSTHSSCVTAPNEFNQKAICDRAKDQASCESAPAAQNGISGKDYCKWNGSSCVVNYANFESFCSQENDQSVCDRIYKPVEKPGCCGINDKVKDHPMANDWFQSCKSKGKDSCNGDCQWNEAPKRCDEPKKPGCCGHNENIKPNGNTIVAIFNYCKTQDYKSCKDSCQWNLPPKQCNPPKVEADKPGCCGVNDLVKNLPSAYTMFQSCKLKKNKGECNGDCQWNEAPKTCDEPKKPVDKPGCCGVLDQVKNLPIAYTMFQACKTKKNKDECRGDCQWNESPKTCDEPKKPEEKRGCCDLNDKVRSLPSAPQMFLSCRTKAKDSCSGDCQWVEAPKTCIGPKKPN